MPRLIPGHLVEKRARHGNSNLRLSAGYGSMGRKYPQIDIFINGQIVGYCMRGHRNILYDNQKRKGLARQAMMHLEEVEREFFVQGHFTEHKQHLISELERQLPYKNRDTVQERRAIREQKEPVHFDFTVIAESAGHLLKNGYLPHRVTVTKLRRMGFKGKTTPQSVAHFIAETQKERLGQIVYLLVKPIK